MHKGGGGRWGGGGGGQAPFKDAAQVHSHFTYNVLL